MRLFRALLLLHPPEVRRRFGAEMEEAFRDQLEAVREREGWPGAVRLYGRTAAGMAKDATTAWGRRRTHGTGGGATMDGWMRDARTSARALTRSPGFTALTVLTIGLGTGAFGAVWSVAERVLFAPMPYEDPGELAWIWRDYTWAGFHRGWMGGPDVAWMRDEGLDVSAVRAERYNLDAAGGLDPRDVRALAVSADFFELLGRGPAVGRGFLPGEDGPDAPGVAVLGHGLWTGTFAGDPDVVGREIRLDREVYTVVGVLPRGFDFVQHASIGDRNRADLYVPLRADLATAQDVGSGWLGALLRLPTGSEAQALALVERVEDRLDEEFGGRGLELVVTPLREDLVGDVRAPLLAVVGAAGILLMALGANLATLLLSRAVTRERDVAIRRALGAGRARVARGVLVETGLLTAAGAAVGVGVAAWGADLLAAGAAGVLPRHTEIGLGPAGAAAVVAVAVALGLLASLGPLARLRGTDPGAALRAAVGGRGAAGRRDGARSALVVAQVALSVVLLVGGGLLGRSLLALVGTDPGFDPAGVLTFRVALDEAAYPEASDLAEWSGRLRTELAGIPGVAAVGLADALPLGGDANQLGTTFPGAPGNVGDPDADQVLADVVRASPGFAEAAGLRVLRGRAFVESDGAPGSPPVAVVDDVLAARFFPDGGAVGARLTHGGGDTATVVGVIDQPRLYDVQADGRGQVYRPLPRQPRRALYVALRTGGDPAALAAPARAIVGKLDPSIPVSEVRTLREMTRVRLAEERRALGLVGGFGLAALLLSTLGVYGVVSAAVLRRRGEIGVRMAMGAGGPEVAGMVVGRGVRLALGGAVLGVLGAWAGTRVLAGLLYGVAPVDPATYAAVVVLLVGTAALAAWLPARRATRISPVEALRS